MTSKQPGYPFTWQQIARKKKTEQLDRIPRAWRLPQSPPRNDANLLDVPRQCGLLTHDELRITEDYDAYGLAEAIRGRQFSCTEVTRAFCKVGWCTEATPSRTYVDDMQRAAIAHQVTNCLTEVLFEEALQKAAQLDQHLLEGKSPLGPLHGVPISFKDTFMVKGHDTSIGLAALCYHPALKMAALVDVLLRAGAVLYCKTNVPQTLMALDSHNNIFGRTLNPLNTELTAGGSSGGEGVLLAMRGSVLGVGTDVGGSIRIPAMCNGVFGLKPSSQRIPYAGQENGTRPAASRLGIAPSAGPLARSTRDIKLFFNAVSQQRPWEQDPDVVPQDWNNGLAAVKRPRRMGLVRRDGIVEPHPPILRLLDEVASRVKHSGIEVVEIDAAPLLSQCQSVTNGLFGIEGANTIFDLIEACEEPLSPWLEGRLRRKSPLSIGKLLELQERKAKLQVEALNIWRDSNGEAIDAIICPVAPHPVPQIDQWNGVNYTSAFNLLDYPAGVVPVRSFEKRDTQGDMSTVEPLNRWDSINRELWENVDRSVYIGSPLCVQVVAPKLQEERLCDVMTEIATSLDDRGHSPTSKL